MKIELLKDDTYQVVEYKDEPYERNVLFQGSLADVNAYISLVEKGYDL